MNDIVELYKDFLKLFAKTDYFKELSAKDQKHILDKTHEAECFGYYQVLVFDEHSAKLLLKIRSSVINEYWKDKNILEINLDLDDGFVFDICFMINTSDGKTCEFFGTKIEKETLQLFDESEIFEVVSFIELIQNFVKNSQEKFAKLSEFL